MRIIILSVLKEIQAAVWGIPTMALLLFTGLYLTVRLKGLQFTQLPRAIRYIFEKEEGKGDVSAFGSDPRAVVRADVFRPDVCRLL